MSVRAPKFATISITTAMAWSTIVRQRWATRARRVCPVCVRRVRRFVRMAQFRVAKRRNRRRRFATAWITIAMVSWIMIIPEAGFHAVRVNRAFVPRERRRVPMEQLRAIAMWIHRRKCVMVWITIAMASWIMVIPEVGFRVARVNKAFVPQERRHVRMARLRVIAT